MLNKLLNQMVNETETLAGEIGAKDAFDKKLELLKVMNEMGVEPIQYNVQEVSQAVIPNNDKVLEVVKLLVKEMQNMEKTILALHNNVEVLKKQQVQVEAVASMPVELDEALARIEGSQKDMYKRFDLLEEKLNNVSVQAPQATVETNESGELQQVKVYTKSQFEEERGYKVSDAAFLEYLDIQKQYEDSFKGLCEEPKEWVPGAYGDGYPAPEGFFIPLYVLEAPCYEGYYINLLKEQQEGQVEETEDEKALRIAEEDAAKIEETIVDPETGEEIVEEEVENEVEVDVEEPVEETAEEEIEDTWEDYGVTEEEVMNNIPDDVVVKHEEEVEEETDEDDLEYFTEDGDDVTDKVRILKQMNADLSEEDYIELATDWLTYLPDAKDLEKFSFVPNTEKDVITAKIYIEFYANERGDQAVQDEINYWSQNVDEEGLYIEEERFYDFLNESNIEAFTEHLFNVFEE